MERQVMLVQFGSILTPTTLHCKIGRWYKLHNICNSSIHAKSIEDKITVTAIKKKYDSESVRAFIAS